MMANFSVSGLNILFHIENMGRDSVSLPITMSCMEIRVPLPVGGCCRGTPGESACQYCCCCWLLLLLLLLAAAALDDYHSQSTCRATKKKVFDSKNKAKKKNVIFCTLDETRTETFFFFSKTVRESIQFLRNPCLHVCNWISNLPPPFFFRQGWISPYIHSAGDKKASIPDLVAEAESRRMQFKSNPSFPTTNGGMQNGSSVGTRFLHVWHRFVSSVGLINNTISTS